MKALAPLLTKWQAVTGQRGGGGFPRGGGSTNLSAEAQAKQVAELTAETDKALAATLKPEQLTRLREIEQQANGPFGGGGFGGAPVTVPLRVTNIVSSSLRSWIRVGRAMMNQ